jgi:hypothetical protein
VRRRVPVPDSGPTPLPLETMMQTTLSRSAHADQLEAYVREAQCCEPVARCSDCRAKRDEIRAARRDALIHSVSLARPRRGR